MVNESLPTERLGEQGQTINPEKIVLIQCTDTKRKTKAKAKNLYDESSYFRNMKNYAEATGYPWFILSAKHGLVSPETELEPYDEFGLSEQQAIDITNQLPQAQTVELVAGKKYTNPLTPELEQHGYDVLEPYRGLKIGERQQKLKEDTRKMENHTLC